MKIVYSMELYKTHNLAQTCMAIFRAFHSLNSKSRQSGKEEIGPPRQQFEKATKKVCFGPYPNSGPKLKQNNLLR